LKPGLEKVGIFSTESQNTDAKDLFFTMDNETIVCMKPNLNNQPEPIPVEIINYATDFQKRNHGLIDESVLQERTVTIIGLGSGGSAITLDLVRCGVTKLILIDFDDVSLSNLCRSVYDLHDVGRKKTEVIFEKLLRINPCVTIELHDKDACKMARKEIIEVIKKSDLIVEATDSVKSKILINGLAYSSTPIIFPSVYESGKGGDILFTLPGLPCYECVFNSIIDEMKENKKGDWDYTTGQAKPMPALISDIQIIVARSVKLALAILTGDKENSFIEKVTEPGCSILFISNEKNTFGESSFQEFWAKTIIDPDCSCQNLM
jgi:molybdopterin/thiamine biosynthesis adenylyltransferase